MPVEDGYETVIVIVNQHEPEGETSARLLEIAEEKGYSPRVVEAQRGEHDAGLSFRVPEDVAEAFNADRSERWPLEGDAEKTDGQTADNDQDTTPTRARTSKTRE
jgi:hypothetical protein